MSSLINKILGNLATRVMLIIYLSIIFITTFFIVFAYYNELALQEQRQYDKLSAVVSSMAVTLDGDQHEALMNRYVSDKDSVEIRNDSVYQSMSSALGETVKINGLSPMYTLVYDPETGGFIYGVRSDNFIDYKNQYKQHPKELKENLETGGVIPMYMSENGTWLSAFHPIKNSQGEVVALLEADIEFSEFETLVNERYFKEVLIALGVIVLLALFLIPYARKVLLEDEKQKKLTLNQKLTIESKNRDIMDSIRYALNIQSAMLPSVEMINSKGLKGFVLHQAKDVVAGDFYWIEEHDNYLFFAVADCTGHGVPGAIMSILCTTALNKAVDQMGLRDTGEILDAVRAIIIQRLTKGGEEVNDGMDIAICRLNRETNELQYSGANNPIYIYRAANQTIEIAKPCKQPVGRYVKNDAFKCTTFDLEKGDIVYLFTDGFADQFGGTHGKKFKYKPFRELLYSNAGEEMTEQKKRLLKRLREWMLEYDQIDDICVMGVKL